ncbi:MAG: hypothetical protein NTZ24_01285 [Deltaproteobacteria bacterium]|nr:hypothetical protein [Deltaproteobacteria bacterium]
MATYMPSRTPDGTEKAKGIISVQGLQNNFGKIQGDTENDCHAHDVAAAFW